MANVRLDEIQVSDAFHNYLQSSLAQARSENLLDSELLSSAEADLMITGVCMYSDTWIRTPKNNFYMIM